MDNIDVQQLYDQVQTSTERLKYILDQYRQIIFLNSNRGNPLPIITSFLDQQYQYGVLLGQQQRYEYIQDVIVRDLCIQLGYLQQMVMNLKQNVSHCLRITENVKLVEIKAQQVDRVQADNYIYVTDQTSGIIYRLAPIPDKWLVKRSDDTYMFVPPDKIPDNVQYGIRTGSGIFGQNRQCKFKNIHIGNLNICIQTDGSPFMFEKCKIDIITNRRYNSKSKQVNNMFNNSDVNLGQDFWLYDVYESSKQNDIFKDCNAYGQKITQCVVDWICDEDYFNVDLRNINGLNTVVYTCADNVTNIYAGNMYGQATNIFIQFPPNSKDTEISELNKLLQYQKLKVTIQNHNTNFNQLYDFGGKILTLDGCVFEGLTNYIQINDNDLTINNCTLNNFDLISGVTQRYEQQRNITINNSTITAMPSDGNIGWKVQDVILKVTSSTINSDYSLMCAVVSTNMGNVTYISDDSQLIFTSPNSTQFLSVTNQSASFDNIKLTLLNQSKITMEIIGATDDQISCIFRCLGRVNQINILLNNSAIELTGPNPWFIENGDNTYTGNISTLNMQLQNQSTIKMIGQNVQIIRNRTTYSSIGSVNVQIDDSYIIAQTDVLNFMNNVNNVQQFNINNSLIQSQVTLSGTQGSIGVDSLFSSEIKILNTQLEFVDIYNFMTLTLYACTLIIYNGKLFGDSLNMINTSITSFFTAGGDFMIKTQSVNIQQDSSFYNIHLILSDVEVLNIQDSVFNNGLIKGTLVGQHYGLSQQNVAYDILTGYQPVGVFTIRNSRFNNNNYLQNVTVSVDNQQPIVFYDCVFGKSQNELTVTSGQLTCLFINTKQVQSQYYPRSGGYNEGLCLGFKGYQLTTIDSNNGDNEEILVIMDTRISNNTSPIHCKMLVVCGGSKIDDGVQIHTSQLQPQFNKQVNIGSYQEKSCHIICSYDDIQSDEFLLEPYKLNSDFWKNLNGTFIWQEDDSAFNNQLTFDQFVRIGQYDSAYSNMYMYKTLVQQPTEFYTIIGNTVITTPQDNDKVIEIGRVIDMRSCVNGSDWYTLKLPNLSEGKSYLFTQYGTADGELIYPFIENTVLNEKCKFSSINNFILNGYPVDGVKDLLEYSECIALYYKKNERVNIRSTETTRLLHLSKIQYPYNLQIDINGNSVTVTPLYSTYDSDLYVTNSNANNGTFGAGDNLNYQYKYGNINVQGQNVTTVYVRQGSAQSLTLQDIVLQRLVENFSQKITINKCNLNNAVLNEIHLQNTQIELSNVTVDGIGLYIYSTTEFMDDKVNIILLNHSTVMFFRDNIINPNQKIKGSIGKQKDQDITNLSVGNQLKLIQGNDTGNGFTYSQYRLPSIAGYSVQSKSGGDVVGLVLSEPF